MTFRSLIKQNCSWTRTKTMLLLNIRRSWLLPDAPLWRVYFRLLLRIHPNHQSSLQLVHGLRSDSFPLFLWVKKKRACFFCLVGCDVLFLTLCSNNCNHCLKLSARLSRITFVVWNPIIFLSHQSLRIKMFCNNYVVG